MKTRLLFLLALILALLDAKSLQASEELRDTDKESPAHKYASSFMTHQEVKNRLSLGLFPSKKLRIQTALAPAAQEYLTEEFITIVQNFSHKMNIYEKCYVIRAVLKLPVEHLTMLKGLMVDHGEELQIVSSIERVSFIKKLNKIEPNQWQAEIAILIEKYHK